MTIQCHAYARRGDRRRRRLCFEVEVHLERARLAMTALGLSAPSAAITADFWSRYSTWTGTRSKCRGVLLEDVGLGAVADDRLGGDDQARLPLLDRDGSSTAGPV